MIYGIGQDVVEIERMERAWQRFGDRFARRILADSEWSEFAAAAQPPRFLAKRFAAKEAFAKALGTGIRPPATLGNIAIDHDDYGRPSLRLAPELDAFIIARGVVSHHLSISDERSIAVSVCVLQKAP
ncbi:MAG: holo-ACP synthase [Rhodocyclaceae bacterium]|nr:holo-ACP synthase [Rhodocyclaceae bacterium]